LMFKSRANVCVSIGILDSQVIHCSLDKYCLYRISQIFTDDLNCIACDGVGRYRLPSYLCLNEQQVIVIGDYFYDE
jgi:hypothetical protein